MAKKKADTVPDDLLGTVELMVIGGVEACREDACGMTVFEAIREHHPRISFGSVFATLERLTWKGYLESRLGEPEPTRGGRARKYYRVTALGKKVAARTGDALRPLLPETA